MSTEPIALPPLPESHRKGITGRSFFDSDQMRAYALSAVAALSAQVRGMSLPKSYGGSTFATNVEAWGDQTNGCTLRLHFTDAKEAEAWLCRLTDKWDAMASAAQEG